MNHVCISPADPQIKEQGSQSARGEEVFELPQARQTLRELENGWKSKMAELNRKLQDVRDGLADVRQIVKQDLRPFARRVRRLLRVLLLCGGHAGHRQVGSKGAGSSET
ncbi:MAG: hypothetical protein RMJ16_07065 [Thermoguttaceae bacterium]|nr:hypothetical protein [Thermoguttaceae bacterium]